MREKNPNCMYWPWACRDTLCTCGAPAEPSGAGQALMCAKEVTIHSAKRYRFNEATQAFDEVDDATVQDFLQTHPVGTVWREYVAAPGTGFIDYRVTRYTADTVYGVQIRSTVRELTAEEAR